jgi:hypothetical protein
VSGPDLAKWKTWHPRTETANHLNGDADGDRDVDGADFLSWQRQVGTRTGFTSVATTTAQAVPEPTGVILAAATALAFCTIRRSGT